MMKRIYFMLKICILIALILNINLLDANALEFTNSIDGSTVSCDSNADETIAVKVVSCIKNVINNYSTALLAFMTTLMEPIIWALILLCIILTAMRVMLGERNPVKIILASFFKILVVIMLANNFGAGSGMFGEPLSPTQTANEQARLAERDQQRTEDSANEQARLAERDQRRAEDLANEQARLAERDQRRAEDLANEQARLAERDQRRAEDSANDIQELLELENSGASQETLDREREQLAEREARRQEQAAQEREQLAENEARRQEQAAQEREQLAENEARRQEQAAQEREQLAENEAGRQEQAAQEQQQLANRQAASSGGLKDVTFLLMEGMQTVIVDNMYEDTATCQLSNHSGQTSALISESAYRPFAYMDCILEYIMGFNIAAGIGASLLGFISSALFSGTMGASVFFFGIATLLAVTFFVLRVIFTVIVCYIYAGLLIGLAPMIVWTLMFKYSEQAFFKYLYNILAAVFMPFLMVAFMAFAIPLLDRYVLDPNEPQSLVNVLGTQESGGGVGTGDRIVDHYRPESPLCNMQTPTDPLYAQGLDQTQIRENSLNPLQTGSFDWCSTFRVHSVDLGERYDPTLDRVVGHNERLWNIAQSLLQILFIVWIITSVGNWIPQLASGLLQSQGAGALAHLISSDMPMEGLLQGGFRSQVTAATATNGQPLGGFNGMGSLFGKFR
jgi:hypothetical protein